MKIFLSFYSFLLLPALALAQPVDFQWAIQIGSNRNDYVVETAINKAGDIYLVGTFQETVDMDPGSGSFEITASGGIGIYISKLDARGNFLWAKQIGNDDAVSNEGVRDIGIDAVGNIYITGSFGGTADFDPNAGVFEMTATGLDAAYLLKLDPNGNFIWAKSIAQSSNLSDGITTKVSAAGNIYVMGSFLGETDLDPGPGVLNVTAPVDDIFISKFDNAGNLIWSRQFFSTLGLYAGAIEIDNLENIYATGNFTGISDFDPSAAVYNLVSDNQDPILRGDCFITKLDLDGGFVWAKQFGGPGNQHGADLALDQSGNLYVAGDFTAPTDFDPGAGVHVVDGKTAGTTFITKLTVQGDFLWAKALSPVTMGQSLTSSMTCDKMGNVYLAGGFAFAVDFDPGDDQFILDGQDMYDMFLLKLRADGSFVSVLQFGNSNATCLAANVALDNHDNIYVNGFFRNSIDFDPTANTHILSTNGRPNGYLLKLGHCLLETSESVTICEGSEYKGYTAGGTYADTLFSTTGCDSVHTIQLQVNPATRKTVDVSICQGETYFAGGSNQTVPGIYLDTLKNFLGCDSIVTTKLTVNPNPVPDLGVDGSICASSMQLLPGLFASYKWQDQSTSSAFTANGPGIFWVEVTDANHCVAVDTIDITTILQVPSGFLKDADSLCRYQTLPLRSASDFRDYLWSTGSKQPVLVIGQPGKYVLQVKDDNGCYGTDTINVYSKNCETGVYFPTAFTPNGDLVNDIFRSQVRGTLVTYKLQIFNRWGGLVFTTMDPHKGWDGTAKGENIGSNVFVWSCRYQLQGSSEVEDHGVVTLIR